MPGRSRRGRRLDETTPLVEGSTKPCGDEFRLFTYEFPETDERAVGLNWQQIPRKRARPDDHGRPIAGRNQDANGRGTGAVAKDAAPTGHVPRCLRSFVLCWYSTDAVSVWYSLPSCSFQLYEVRNLRTWRPYNGRIIV